MSVPQVAICYDGIEFDIGYWLSIDTEAGEMDFDEMMSQITSIIDLKDNYTFVAGDHKYTLGQLLDEIKDLKYFLHKPKGLQMINEHCILKAASN